MPGPMGSEADGTRMSSGLMASELPDQKLVPAVPDPIAGGTGGTNPSPEYRVRALWPRAHSDLPLLGGNQ